MFSSTNNNVNFAKCRKIYLDDTESDIEEYSDHELPLSSIITLNNDNVNAKCQAINLDDTESDIEEYSDHELPLSSIITLNNDNVNAKCQEINVDGMESDLENYSDHELPLSSIINILQPINNHKIVNTDIQNSTSIDCGSILNINHDNKSEINLSSKNKDQSIIDNQINMNIINKYECDICEKIFSKRTLIIKHFKTSVCFPKNAYYFENNNYSYDRYKSFENLMSYINYTNNLKEAYKCSICQTVILNKMLIKNCQILDTKKNNLKCVTCLNLNGNINENTECTKEKYKWKCEMCGEIFTTLSILEAHKCICSENTLFDYDKSYLNFGALIKDKKMYKVFSGANKRIFNLKSINKSKYYMKNVNSKSNIFKNINKLHNSSQNYECSTCSKVFHKRFKIITHIFTNHQEDYSKYSCDSCSNLYDSSQEFILHVEKNFLKCDVCPRSFTTSHRLHQHYRWHLGINNFKCQFCPKTFLKCSAYLLHERTHTREKPFRCHFCNKWYPISSNLNIHLGFDDPFICNICEKSFSKMSSFLSHKRIHVFEKQLISKRLNKSFYQSLTSKTHLGQRQHTGKKMFKCKVCNKLFIQVSTLNAHSKTHTKRYFNKINIHSKVLTKSSYSNKHKRILENDKYFKCDLCQEIFSDWNIFTTHRCTSYKCRLCSKILSNSSLLNKHMNIHINKKTLKENENKQKEKHIQTQNECFKLNMNNSVNELEENDVKKEYKCDLCAKIFHKQCQIYDHILETHY